MRKELSPAAVWSVIVLVVVVAGAIIIFGVYKPQIGPGPEVQPKPFAPPAAWGQSKASRTPGAPPSPNSSGAPAGDSK